MTFTCEFCSGTRFILAQPELGPCVCVTPENFRDLAAMYEDAEKELADFDDKVMEATKVQRGAADHAEAIIEHAAQALERYMSRLGLGFDPVTIADPDLAALSDLLH